MVVTMCVVCYLNKPQIDPGVLKRDLTHGHSVRRFNAVNAEVG